MTPTNMPFGIKRLKFSNYLEIVLAIKNPQGQYLKVSGLNLEYPWSIYVTYSRVGRLFSLFVLAPDNKKIIQKFKLNNIQF